MKTKIINRKKTKNFFQIDIQVGDDIYICDAVAKDKLSDGNTLYTATISLGRSVLTKFDTASYKMFVRKCEKFVKNMKKNEELNEGFNTNYFVDDGFTYLSSAIENSKQSFLNALRLYLSNDISGQYGFGRIVGDFFEKYLSGKLDLNKAKFKAGKALNKADNRIKKLLSKYDYSGRTQYEYDGHIVVPHINKFTGELEGEIMEFSARSVKKVGEYITIENPKNLKKVENISESNLVEAIKSTMDDIKSDLIESAKDYMVGGMNKSKKELTERFAKSDKLGNPTEPYKGLYTDKKYQFFTSDGEYSKPVSYKEWKKSTLPMKDQNGFYDDFFHSLMKTIKFRNFGHQVDFNSEYRGKDIKNSGSFTKIVDFMLKSGAKLPKAGIKAQNDLVGKKDVKVVTESKKESISSKDIKRIADMTDYNDHTGSLIYLAKILGEDSILRDLKKIENDQNKNGHLTSNSSTKRLKLMKKLLRIVKDDYGKDTHKKVYGAL